MIGGIVLLIDNKPKEPVELLNLSETKSEESPKDDKPKAEGEASSSTSSTAPK